MATLICYQPPDCEPLEMDEGPSLLIVDRCSPVAPPDPGPESIALPRLPAWCWLAMVFPWLLVGLLLFVVRVVEVDREKIANEKSWLQHENDRLQTSNQRLFELVKEMWPKG
jgi:hypothetical protein